MKFSALSGLGACLLLLAAATASAEVKVEVGHNEGEKATAEFKFKEVPSPVKNKATTAAKLSIIAGDQDGNGGGVEVLNDNDLPSEEDEPAANFFFNAGTDGGRILIDLGASISVKQVNTYSWHSDARAPQVYVLYAADGAAEGFNAKPAKDVDPAKAGWKLIAKVDTRPKAGEPGGQYGVSISDTTGALGKYRYFLIAASRTSAEDGFSNTFYSEINIIDANEVIAAPVATTGPSKAVVKATLRTDWGRVSRDLSKIMPSPAVLLDPTKRQEIAPKVLPVLKSMVPILADLAAAKAQNPGMIADDTIRVQACLSYLGDAETIKSLETVAAGDDKTAAARAKLAQDLAAWWQAGKDEKAQGKILAEVQKLATAAPADGRIFFTLMAMKEIGAATAELSDQAEGIVADTLTGEDSSFVRDVYHGRVKQKAAMNKPIEFAGKTNDDKDFSTKEYKGKVVLIDFWATWCGPCVAENPRVKALYAKYHDKGLEIVGISCDGEGDKLTAYIKKQSIPWVQMWDKKAQAGTDDSWHPIAKSWGVLSIPQMFLIDKEGNLRTVEARENMEEMIPKLLEEKAAK